MATPLKNQFGPDVPDAIATMLAAVHPPFPRDAFVRDALRGYEALELMPRGRHIAHALQRHLPAHFPAAIEVLLASLSQPTGRTAGAGMASFLFMPHGFFVAEYGLDHFEASMRAQHALTQRFTAEFSIRPFLMRHPQATLAQLAQWAHDPSEHVRRLVSEGTRPRLPWAPRLPAFQADPAPVLALLELLRDDPALYVRRSVANNLNDIGKDHPRVLATTARRWLQDATPERDWVVRHALRWAVKQGAPWALDTLGFGHAARVTLGQVAIHPARARIGDTLRIAFTVHNPAPQPQDVLVDLQVHYIKANGAASPKVFKLKTVELGAGQTVHLRKTVSLADMSTRRHHPGEHRVDVLVNGQAMPLGRFALLPPAPL
jgi:3-methyladenine DNA glycosylase AlkC